GQNLPITGRPSRRYITSPATRASWSCPWSRGQRGIDQGRGDDVLLIPAPRRSLSQVDEHFSAISFGRRDSHAGHVLAHPGRRATGALVRTFAILAYRYRCECLSVPNRIVGDEAGSVTKQFLHFILPLVELVDQLRHAAITPYDCVHAATPYAWGIGLGRSTPSTPKFGAEN